MGGLYIGTSGWSYREWAAGFYAGVRQADWLPRYAEQFRAVEVNATFYRRIGAPTLKAWRDATPRNFRFTIKAGRFLTHMQRLNMTAKSIAVLHREADVLSPKLAVVLWQLPATLKLDTALLARFLERLDRWKTVRHAVEFRDRSWFNDATARALSRHRIAVVQSDAPRWPLWDAVTTNLVYVRLHGGSRLYASSYRTATLARWAERVRRWRSEGRAVHVYFDNTEKTRALGNARQMAAMCGA